MKKFLALSVFPFLFAGHSAFAQAYECPVTRSDYGAGKNTYYFIVEPKGQLVGVLDARVYHHNNKLPVMVRPSVNDADTIELRWQLDDFPVRDTQTGSVDHYLDTTFKARIKKKTGKFFVRVNFGSYGGPFEQGKCVIKKK
ncbi:hypothetical protein Q8W37_11345 [Shimia thalassica]|uniref:hypothetical protein n=1 Tax=Shimia thalassica TaxID=1715693 RepID=UPI001C09FD6C|nr:hypothetical protein [Shimia thalassica]MBU2941846.1 hypothetical protein [Shimia thalassica]MDO6483584.1 hypothetical protein [Shimia thalassica]MDO6503772.1 hypothetical protein [Shimia thalassica]MDO6521225.1 hypothetical protein [Shimia thalassica]MDO6800567.1 hypothetical protein [Shimia thalassica]